MENIHFIGIGGTGMSGLARVMTAKGKKVSGSDLAPSVQCQSLARLGAIIYRHHAPENIDKQVDTVVISEAIRESNPELQEARRRGIPVYKYAEMLGQLVNDKFGLAVAGTHGKSTTSGLLTYALKQARLHPSFVVGAKIPQLNTNAQNGRGPYFVAEACEYAGSFLNLNPEMAIITNIEEDHLDYYRDFDEIINAFEKFAGRIAETGLLVIEKQTLKYFKTNPVCRVETYAVEEQAVWQAVNVKQKELGQTFQVKYQGQLIGEFECSLPGRHNVSNALAVIAICHHLGVSFTYLYGAIKNYRGVNRRFETLVDTPIVIIDDYAHHPTEVKAVLQAARERYPESHVWCVFQPHQASRTYRLLDEFAQAFCQADEVIITDIFYARDSQEDKAKVKAQDLSDAIMAQGKKAYHLADFPTIANFLATNWREGDVIFTLGAGNIFQLAYELANKVAEESVSLIPA